MRPDHAGGILPITLPEARRDVAAVLALLEAGCPIIHLRKPGWSTDMLQQWLAPIAPALRQRLTLHGDQGSALALGCGGYHHPQALSGKIRGSRSWHALDEPGVGVDYGLISPVWPSISKQDYKPVWDWPTMAAALPTWPVRVFALGGANPQRCAAAKTCGFTGLAVLGWLWQDEDPDAVVVRWRELLCAWNAV